MAAKENPRKRSDPTKIKEERRKIIMDIEEHEKVPQEHRLYPDLKESQRRRRSPPPVIKGARVIGFKKPATDA